MHTDKVWIVIVLLIVILAGSNLVMFALVRGWTPRKGGKNTLPSLSSFTQPWKQQDEQLKELNQRVKSLEDDEDV